MCDGARNAGCASRTDAGYGRIRTAVVSARCFGRHLPLFFRAAPRTPLRVLGLIALDTLHVLRHSQPLPRKTISQLAMFLDFQGCANAAWDHKDILETNSAAIRQRLEQGGLGSCIEDYLSRLAALETSRPSIIGTLRGVDDVRNYREGVARLSIGAAAAIAFNAESLEAGIRATQSDRDVGTLFLILMQCQIIDDVLDYDADAAAGLPSFLTASPSLPQAMDSTFRAAESYAAASANSPGPGIFPFRVALRIVSGLAKLVVQAFHPHLTRSSPNDQDSVARSTARAPSKHPYEIDDTGRIGATNR